MVARPKHVSEWINTVKQNILLAYIIQAVSLRVATGHISETAGHRNSGKKIALLKWPWENPENYF